MFTAAEATRAAIGDWTSIGVGLLSILVAVGGVLWRQAQLHGRVAALADAVGTIHGTAGDDPTIATAKGWTVA